MKKAASCLDVVALTFSFGNEWRCVDEHFPVPCCPPSGHPRHQHGFLGDATLWNDPAAQAWLDGDGPSSVLDRDDRWQKK